MFNEIEWLFFDVGSTIMNEQIAYEHRIRDMANLANMSFEKIYEMALAYYRQNKKGDRETAKFLGIEVPEWHREDEILYDDALPCFETLSKKYKIGIIANQSFGTKDRLEKHGILKYIDLITASAEEGVEKPNRRIFEIALERCNCKSVHTIMIGDRIDNDIVPANLIGMNTIWIKRGFWQYWNIKQKLEKPDFVINNLMELCDIL